MIRIRVILVLAMMILLFIGGGLITQKIASKYQDRFETVWQSDYPKIKAVHEIARHVGQLNLRYIPLLAKADGGVAVTAELFDELSSRIREKTKEIEEEPIVSKVGRDVANRLTSAVDNYLNILDKHVGDSGSWSEVNQRELLQSARRIEMLADQAISLHEADILAQDADLAGLDARTGNVILFSVAGSTLIAGICFWQLGAGIVRPIHELTHSVQEIRNRNFELSIPVHSRDELGLLSSAFNDMATELRVLLQETDEKILKANVQSRAILTAFPHPIIILDDEGDVSQVNPKAEVLLDQLGTPTRLPKRVADRFQVAYDSTEDYLPEDLDETILLRIEEEEFFYLPGIFRIREADGDVKGWAVVLADVTRLRWLDNMKSHLMATMSHELKTPLTSVRMIIHLLAENRNQALTSEEETLVHSAKDECEKLLGVVDNLLKASQFDSGQNRLDRKAVEVTEILDWGRKLRSNLDPAQSMELEIVSPAGLSDVFVDEIGIKKVIENYLSNAFHYSHEGGLIKFGARQLGENFVRFSIYDNGVGIPETIHDSLFDKFVRGPGQEDSGVGLGLSICREIVGAHGGRVGFRSGKEDEDFTTEFYFDLPTVS